MTWQLGSKPGVVDAVDRYGRPMEVPLRSDAFLVDFADTWPPLDDPAFARARFEPERRSVPHGAQLWLAGICGVALLLVGWAAGEIWGWFE